MLTRIIRQNIEEANRSHNLRVILFLISVHLDLKTPLIMNGSASNFTKIKIEDDRTGIDLETLKRAFLDNLFYIQGKYPEVATRNDYYMALAYTVRDRLLHRWLNTQKTYHEKNERTVGYLSAEFLVGPHLGNNLINMGLFSKFKKALKELGLNLNYLLDQEEEPGLGNGGLGRLAACYLDSMATLDIPAIGYGIRYEFGIFDQEIHDGWQVEITDKWLRYGNPWEIPRIEHAQNVMFGGHIKQEIDEKGKHYTKWVANEVVKGIPYDTPILGYDTNTAATLRLWKAEACESFDFQTFNRGDFYGAVHDKIGSENISKILYPNDLQMAGRELRLRQQYFFVSCSLKDVIKNHLDRGNKLTNLHDKFALQLNDTHPTIAIPELMRILVDEHRMEWNDAWEITTKTIAFTNHTLMPEAMERWRVSLMGSLLPRHLDIILEINQRFLEEVKQLYPGDYDRVKRMSIIDESGERYIRMVNLACVGAHAINGVAKLHTKLLKQNALADFDEMWPGKISNKTNGVTPRRWVVLNNQPLTNLITEKIGEGWIKNLDELRQLEEFAEDPNFIIAWQKAKRKMKKRLAKYIRKTQGIEVNINSMFDVQVKRFHEYKRQYLNVLHIITLYNRLKDDPALEVTPRTFIFGGKAAPAYDMAKLVIKLINSVKDVVNNDPDVNEKMKIVFLPDFNVTNSQRVYPAADLSEQLSTAGMEASGTGNMKFSMNGALTIGTLDGANIEIRDAVGHENFFLFGHTAEEVEKAKASGFDPKEFYNSNDDLKRCLDLISSGFFSQYNKDLFKPLVDSLFYGDYYFTMGDYESYVAMQDEVGELFKDLENWARMSILNVARIGEFSSDRSIRDYCSEIWDAHPVHVEIAPYNPILATDMELDEVEN